MADTDTPVTDSFSSLREGDEIRMCDLDPLDREYLFNFIHIKVDEIIDPDTMIVQVGVPAGVTMCPSSFVRGATNYAARKVRMYKRSVRNA